VGKLGAQNEESRVACIAWHLIIAVNVQINYVQKPEKIRRIPVLWQRSFTLPQLLAHLEVIRTHPGRPSFHKRVRPKKTKGCLSDFIRDARPIHGDRWSHKGCFGAKPSFQLASGSQWKVRDSQQGIFLQDRVTNGEAAV